MASEPFSIEIDSFEGGLAQGPYTGQPNQYAYATGMDQWTEPGSLVGGIDFSAFTYGPISNSSYTGALLAIDVHGETAQSPSGTNFFTLQEGVSRDLFVSGFNSTSNGSLSNGPEILNTDLDVGASDFDFANTIRIYLGSILAGGSGDDTVYQKPNMYTNSSVFSYGKTGYTVSDIVQHFEYAYFLLTPTIAASDSSPAHMVRYDYSNSSYLNSSAVVVLDPAVELSPGWAGVDSDIFGDYISIVSVNGKGGFYSNWYDAPNSRLYLWDGISTTFDSKIDIQGAAITASKAHLGNIYLFGSGRGGVDIYRYAGGNVVQKVGRASISVGTVSDSTDADVAYVRKESITTNGDFIYFGTTIPTTPNPKAKFYSFNVRTGAIDMVLEPTNASYIRSILSACVTPTMSLVSYVNDQTGSSLKGFYAFSSTTNSSVATNTRTGRTSDWSVVTSSYFAPIGKKMKVNRALVRHSYLPTDNALSVTINRNHETVARGVPTTALASVTGADANTPGVGDSSFYEHVYTFTQADGQPVPLLDAFQLGVSVTNASGTTDRPRVFLPIVIEGEYIDSPN